MMTTDLSQGGADASTLYRIEEFPELFADACLRNSDGEFKFLSFYGRDGSVMQFLAALELGVKDGGSNRLHLVNDAGERHAADVGNAGRLDKFAGRLPKQNLFGPLSQVWLYDKSLLHVDRTNRIGWVLHRGSSEESDAQCGAALLSQAWRMTRQLSPVALLDDWRESLQAWCLEARAFERMDDPRYPPIGGIHGMRVSISDHFLRYVSEGVRSRFLAT